jgi:hypothetical protein
MIGYLLFLIARTVAILSSPLGILYTVVRRYVKGKRKTLGSYRINMAYVYDVLINVCWGDFLNDVFSKWDAYPYGNPNDSLSRVLGKNKAIDKLKKTEAWVAKQLNRIDPNHVEKAI